MNFYIVLILKFLNLIFFGYSNIESLKKSFKEGLCTYYSRSRNELWTKGLTSGNTQELLNAKYDCDQDAILFTVKQKGNACHLDRYSCFEDKNFTFEELFELIETRKNELPENSYTTKLFKDEFYLKRKIMEEAFKIAGYKTKGVHVSYDLDVIDPTIAPGVSVPEYDGISPYMQIPFQYSFPPRNPPIFYIYRYWFWF